MMKNYFDAIIDEFKNLDYAKVENLTHKIIETSLKGGKVYVFGNGGSAHNSAHFCTDLFKGCRIDGKPPILAIDLSNNVGTTTAIGNDLDYSQIFKFHLESYFDDKILHSSNWKNDLVIAISGSGNSPSIVEAIKYSNDRGVYSFGITGNYKGKAGGQLAQLATDSLIVPSLDMGRIEVVHAGIMHAIPEEIREIFEKASLEELQQQYFAQGSMIQQP